MTSVIEPQISRSPRVPPNSIDAEESVLGAVLLSADAANIALEKLHAELDLLLADVDMQRYRTEASPSALAPAEPA